MIDATHLRIGNLVQHYQMGNKLAHSITPIIGKVTAIQGKYFTIDHKIGSQDSKGEPIPLSGEWLNKMGFQETVPGSNATHGLMIPFTPICIQVFKFGSDFIAQLMLYPDYKLSQPKRFIHEVQNLYWSLVENELEIKL